MSRIRANTLSLGISFFGTAVFALIQYKIITTSMDQVDVGKWSALFAMGALLGVLTELGFPMVVVRFAARYDATRRLVRLRRLIGFCLKVHLSAVLLMVGLLLWLGPQVARFGDGDLTRWQILLAYLALSSGSLRALNNASFRGLRRMGWMAGLEILFAILLTVGYYSFRHRMTVEILLLVFWVCSLAVALAGLAVLLRMLRELKDEPDGQEAFQVPILSEVRSYWGGAAAAGVFLIAVESVDRIVLAAILSYDATAVFQVATRLALFPRRLLYVPLQVMTPEVTHKWESGKREELREDIRLFVKLLMGLGLVLIGPIAVFAKPLILLVSTAEYLDGAQVLWVFAGVIPLLTLYQPLTMVFRAVGHVWHAFIADAGWLVIYLGVGSLLARPLGLPGFVAGQVVASLCVLSYTLFAVSRLGLPGPSTAFFAKRVVLAALVWGPCVMAGRALPADASILFLAATGVALLITANLLIVLGGYLSPKEEQRTLTLVGGRGAVGALLGFLFRWPRRLVGRAGASASLLVLVGSLAGVSGCGEEIPPGCSTGDAVPESVREEVELAAHRFWEQVRAGDAAGVFAGTASAVRQQSDQATFTESIRRQMGPFDFPQELTTQDLQLVYLKRGHPIEFPIQCDRVDGDGQDALNLMRHPLQASLIQTSTVNGIVLQYAYLFWFEDDAWRLGEFRVKLAEYRGQDWRAFEELADAQLAKGHRRNAALLYNLAIELAVPNPWTRPGPVNRLESKQKSIAVSHLPADRLDKWDVDGTEYRVYQVAYDLLDGRGLGVAVSYDTFEDVSDTTVARHSNDILADWVKREFPEYRDVFRHMLIRVVPAEVPGDPGYVSVYPFREAD